MSARWDPDQYLKYEEERGRPFADLMCRLEGLDPKVVVDLGCGPGNTTAQLLDRWPGARVVGIDNSAEMIERAKAFEEPGRLEFRHHDLREWEPDEPVDALLCSATFQWIDDHVGLFPGFVNALAPGGAFAFQVPGNFAQPSHTLLYELASSDRWAPLLAHLVRPTPVPEPAGYLTALLAAGSDADVWETTYLHVLRGPDAVLEWVCGTGLRPFLTALDESGAPGDTDTFLATYSAVLRAAYPRDAEDRTVFPFRRIFGIGRRPRDQKSEGA